MSESTTHSDWRAYMSPAQPEDEHWMMFALEEAKKAIGVSAPNPSVGSVIVRDGEVLGSGHTQRVGGPHAEVMALRSAFEAMKDVTGATAYVTLEPCSHFGRTPPCADTLLKAGIGRVVAATVDPNPQVAGRGLKRLAQHMPVTCGVCEAQAMDINAGFIKRMKTGVPYVRLKSAMTLDGYTALPNGESKWITGEAARADGRRWRARSGAVITGIGTVLSDDPQMTARGAMGTLEPLRVVVDATLATPVNARLFDSPGVIIVCAHYDEARASALRARGGEIWHCPSKANPDRVDLAKMLFELGQIEINEVLVEAGLGLNSAFLSASLVDELVIYQAPCFFAQGLPMARFPVPEAPGAAPRWTIKDITRVGEDQRILLGRTS